MPPESIGSATKLVQGYPTQLWLPQSPRARQEGHFAVVHDRSDCGEQPGIFLMPGNPKKSLRENVLAYKITTNDGQTYGLRIPAAVLWDFHGEPCMRRGDRYAKISKEVMDQVYYRLTKLAVLSALRIYGKELYVGPFDTTPQGNLNSGAKTRLMPMSSRLISR